MYLVLGGALSPGVGGVWSGGVCLAGGMPGGVSGLGGVYPGEGVCSQRGVYIPACTEVDPPPC